MKQAEKPGSRVFLSCCPILSCRLFICRFFDANGSPPARRPPSFAAQSPSRRDPLFHLFRGFERVANRPSGLPQAMGAGYRGGFYPFRAVWGAGRGRHGKSGFWTGEKSGRRKKGIDKKKKRFYNDKKRNVMTGLKAFPPCLQRVAVWCKAIDGKGHSPSSSPLNARG